MRTFHPILLVLLLGMLPAAAADYFVATTGDNGDPGTELLPFATINHAATVASAGDTVWIAPGTYQPSSPILPANSGTQAAPITYRALPGGPVVIDGQSTVPTAASRHGLFYISGQSWIVVDGLRIINSGFFGFLMKNNASNITIRNCSTFSTGASGICAAGVSNITVLNNSVQQACIAPDSAESTSECITMASVNTFEVAYNTVFDRPVDLNNGGEGIDAKNACLNGTIHHNLVYDLYRIGIYVDAYAANLSNVEVHSNTVHNCAGGITVASEEGATLEGVIIRDNLVRDCRRGAGIRLAGYLGNGPLVNVDVYQNTVVRCGKIDAASNWEDCCLLVEADNPLNAGFNVRNNIFAQDNTNTPFIRTKTQSYLTLDRNLLDGTASSGVTGTNAIVAGALFVNAAANDFHLGSASPAIDAVLGAPLSTVDLEGNPRIPPGDLGAFEWIEQPQATTTTLASTANPSPATGVVTVTATVTAGSGVPSGTVTFYDGALELGTNTLDAAGATTLTTSALGTGSHSIAGVYAPASGNYAASTSPALAQSVTPGPLAPWVRAYFTDGTGIDLPHQYFGSAGEGWLGNWSSLFGSALVQSGNPLAAGSGKYLAATRDTGSGAAFQAGVYRQWDPTVRPLDSFSRLTFAFRIDSDATFNNSGDGYGICLNSIATTSPGSHSCVYLRCFGASPGNDANGNPIRAREWCVFNGIPGTDDNGYAVSKFVRTGLIAAPGVTCSFTIDIYAAAAAGTTKGKTHGTYDVTITDGTDTFSIFNSGFRANPYTSGGYLAFATQQNDSNDDLSFSVDSINLAPQNAAPVVAAGSDQTITLPATANLTGTATDDGLPVPSALATTWSKISGPGSITFGSSTAHLTTAAFSVAGTYVLRLTGNDGSLPATDDLTVTVLPAPTTTSVVSSANPATPGATVNFTATVTAAAGTPGGTVIFLDGVTALGTGTLDGSGVATFAIASLPVGSHAIIASYGATANYEASNSPILDLEIVTLYEAWLSAGFTLAQLGNPALEATVWGELADPDADGSANLLEYAFGTNPNLNASVVHPVPGIDLAGHLKLTFMRVADPALLYEVLGSGDLTGWLPVWSSTGEQNTPGSVTATDTAPPPQDRRFLSLRVTIPLIP